MLVKLDELDPSWGVQSMQSERRGGSSPDRSRVMGIVGV
jgi:hypothetical protein